MPGGLLTEKEASLLQAWRKQSTQRRFSRRAWLDAKIKLVTAEPFLASLWERRLRRRTLEAEAFPGRMFTDSTNADTPELTQVVLVTLETAVDRFVEELSH